MPILWKGNKETELNSFAPLTEIGVERMGTVSKRNLEMLSKLYNIIWTQYFIHDLVSSRKGRSNSYYVYGILGTSKVTYSMYKSPSGVGSVSLYFDYGRHINNSIALLKKGPTKSEEKDFKRWLNFLVSNSEFIPTETMIQYQKNVIEKC